jgi:hypothetical protein
MRLSNARHKESSAGSSILGITALAAAVALIFVLGWMLGSSGESAINSSMDYPQAETPEQRYAINVEVDPSFYSFYSEFEEQEESSSVAGLQ